MTLGEQHIDTSDTRDNPPPLAGTVFAAFVEEELTNERDRRTALDARAITVLTTSGTFVTLILALGALVTSAEGYKPPGVVVVLFAIAASCLCMAAVMALLANQLRFYPVVSAPQLRKWTDDESWQDSVDNARWLLVHVRSRTIEQLRVGNAAKANRLAIALWAQLAAFCLLSVAVIIVLLNSM